MKNISYVVKKGRYFWPNNEMKKIANLSDNNIYRKAEKDPIKFWENLAEQGITWEKEWDKTYEEKIPYFKWFKGGQLNFSVNCLDRHLERGNQTALIWIPEPTNERPIKLTYAELYNKVNRLANVLKKYGIKKGDVVSIYLPMIPEA